MIAEPVGFAVAAAVLYLLTWQDALHGTDWRWFVLWLDEAGAVHPQHPGYLVAAHAARWLLAPFGPDTYGVLRVLSIVGGGVAVAGFHRGALELSGEPGVARALAAVAMFSPALWHHATVVELHAPFVAVVAWAVAPAVRLARRGGLRDAVLAGALTGLATLMHATGHLCVLLVAGAVIAAGRGRGWRRLAACLGAFAAVHGAVWAVMFALVRATGNLPVSVGESEPKNPMDYLVAWWEEMDFFAQVGPTVVDEWLEPYAPLSVLVVAALFVPRCRGAAGLLLIALCGYLVVTVALVHAWTDERGAYLLPLLFPAAAIVLRLGARRSWHAAVLAATIASGALFRGEPGRSPPDLEFGAAAVALAQARDTVFFVADFPEMDGAFRMDPRLDLVLARKEHDELRAGGFEPTAEQIGGWLTLLLAQARDRQKRFVITDRAVSWLAERVPAFAAGFELFRTRSGARRLPAAAGIDGYVIG